MKEQVDDRQVFCIDSKGTIFKEYLGLQKCHAEGIRKLGEQITRRKINVNDSNYYDSFYFGNLVANEGILVAQVIKDTYCIIYFPDLFTFEQQNSLEKEVENVGDCSFICVGQYPKMDRENLRKQEFKEYLQKYFNYVNNNQAKKII